MSLIRNLTKIFQSGNDVVKMATDRLDKEWQKESAE